MSSQIFKKEYPKKDLVEFLDKYSEKKIIIIILQKHHSKRLYLINQLHRFAMI